MEKKNIHSRIGISLADVPEICVDFDRKRNNNVDPSVISVGSNKLWWWRCHNCGHTMYESTNQRWRGGKLSECPACSGRVVCNNGKGNSLGAQFPEVVSSWVSELNGGLTPFDVLPHVADKFWFFCKNCGNPTHTTPDVFRKSCGCAECKKFCVSSFGEQFIYHNISKRFPEAKNRCRDILGDGKELDIYLPLPESPVAYEYDGGRWHADDRYKKKVKSDMCKKLGIRLVRIVECPQSDYNEQLEGLQDELYTIKYATDYEGLERVTREILEKLGCDGSDVSVRGDYGVVMDELRSVKAEHSIMDNEYLMKLWHPTKNTVNPLFVTEHSPSRTMWWICPRCGRDWLSSPSHVILGGGCSACSVTGKKKIEQWTLDGKTMLRTFETIAEATAYMHSHASTFVRIFARKPHVGLGFLWRRPSVDDK